MKISKLFHWLYSVVMLLPIFAIGSTCLISTFNNQAKQEYEYNYLYETNDVNGYTYNLRVGNVYHLNVFNGSFDEILHNLDTCRLRFYNLERFDIGEFQNASIDEMLQDSAIYDKSTPFVDLIIYGDDSSFNIGSGINLNADEYLYLIDTGINSYSSFISIVGDFILVDLYIDLSATTNIANNAITKTSNIPFDSIDLHNLSAEDVFYRSVDKVVESPLFNWAYDSFLVAPFSFIVNLFSMPTNSVIVQLLSYWLAISVIWLVFDLVMYVPLLVHRWIDKGVLE